MKQNGLLAEILHAVIRHNKEKIRQAKPDDYLNQKKQLWYRMMNTVDDDVPAEADTSFDAPS